MTIVGNRAPVRASSSWSSRPVISGICRSTIRQPGVPNGRESRNSRPDEKVRASIAEAQSSRANAFRTAESSSTIATNPVSVFAMAHHFANSGQGRVGLGPNRPSLPPRRRGTAALAGRLRPDSRTLGETDEVLDRPHAELPHHPPAVNLDRLLDRAEVTGDLLVETACDDVIEHLALARRELCEICGDCRHGAARLAGAGVGLLCPADGREERVAADGLCQEIDRPRPHGAHAGRNVALAAEENDWPSHARKRQLALQLEAAALPHHKGDARAARDGRMVLGKEVARRCKCPGAVARRAEKPRQAAADGRIVVDHEYREFRLAHGEITRSLRPCKVRVARAPPPGLLVSASWPPCSPTMVEQIASPRPRPCGFVVKNGSTPRACSAGPGPWP